MLAEGGLENTENAHQDPTQKYARLINSIESYFFLRVLRPISKSHNACHFLGLPETQGEVQITWLQALHAAKWGQCSLQQTQFLPCESNPFFPVYPPEAY